MQDSQARTLCYLYCRDDEKSAEVANVLTWDEGRRVAANIAKLSELLKRLKEPRLEEHPEPRL